MFDCGIITFAVLAQTGGYGLEPSPAALPAAAAASGRLHLASEPAVSAPGGASAVLHAAAGASSDVPDVTSPPVAASVAGPPAAVESVVVASPWLLIASRDQALGNRL
jgi:hypothetical protein